MSGFRNGVSILSVILVIVSGSLSQVKNHAWEKQGRFEDATRLITRPARIPLTSSAPVNPVYDVIDYRLDLSAAMVTEEFGGRNTITIVMKSPADSLVLNQHQLTIDSVSVNGSLRSWISDDPAEALVVRLGEKNVSAGDTLRIVVWYYRNPTLARPTDRLGYFYFPTSVGIPSILGYTMSEPREARCWMPCYDQPWEKSTASINVTVPKGYVAASNGKLLDVAENGNGTVTWKWREGHQIATYLMCATISAWAVSSIPFVRAAGDTIPVQFYTWQTDSSTVAGYLPTVRQMIAALSGRYGSYPWDKYGTTAVTPFAYGGMEHQSLTTMHRAYMTNDIVVVHELAHQWWGDLVTCGTWPDIWLNESFATYSEAVWFESTGGVNALLQYMKANLLFYGSWYGSIYDPETQGFGVFPSSVYEKGAWVLHTLRGVIGDQAFFGSLARWRQLYSEQSATTADFQSVVEEVTGKPMGWFFSEWIYGAGWPIYSSAYRWGSDTLHVTIAQSQDAAWPTFRMPLPVKVYVQGNATTLILQDSLRLQTFALPFVQQPDSVIVDPDGWVLKTRGAILDVKAQTQVPGTFLLAQNYPNPFNPTTVVSWQLSVVSNVKLVIYDLMGREVAVLMEGRKDAGRYNVEWNAKGNASGFYICRLIANGLTQSIKMLYLR